MENKKTTPEHNSLERIGCCPCILPCSKSYLQHTCFSWDAHCTGSESVCWQVKRTSPEWNKRLKKTTGKMTGSCCCANVFVVLAFTWDHQTCLAVPQAGDRGGEVSKWCGLSLAGLQLTRVSHVQNNTNAEYILSLYQQHLQAHLGNTGLQSLAVN